MFNFDEPTLRTNIDSVKWSSPQEQLQESNTPDRDYLPMWIADMDFETAPAVKQAILDRAANGTFGYSDIPDEFGQTISSWWKNRHHFLIDPSNIIFVSGVVPAISSAVRSLTNVAEKIVVQPPVYNIFYNSIVNNGRRVYEVPLTHDAEENVYSMDFDALENAFSDPLTTMMILCNPHNPTGNIWSKEDLSRLGDLADKYGVIILSDEIHCEVVRPGLAHIPFASASDVCRDVAITCASPSKAFNTAGIHAAYAMIDNPRIRARFERGINNDEVAEPNSFACRAVIAAYTRCEQWLNELNSYIQANKDYATEKITNANIRTRITESNATYLLWLDCSAITDNAQDLVDYIYTTTGLKLASGEIYGANGKSFIRMNVATQRYRVEDGVNRFISAVHNYLS
ncbi:pyridoxal phosphate-dependent aminotransferase [Alloscardovia theropitheci]|uniref:cysteine-S-conjugate beta-lyase n=1 Tax=Alloscardovia theropitheci TaxID=2496842 RepID=A0A4V2MU54_9BIFI|nr:MalY/PatB family protein [Alloscardovia theropitheci]TCD55049.1 pyridoxal phosphate-dependent aminotransferase [Alloscardovia theropitheci]